MEQNELQFIRGFNSGYILAKHEPQMLSTLVKDLRPNTSYIAGMKGGQREYEQETMKDRLNELERLKNNDKEKNIDRDL